MLKNKYKKAAMFGLDARIALAIFGALSLISGAALYSAINKSKATFLIRSLEEVGKAYEQYYLDTGIPLPPSTNLDPEYYYNPHYLVNDYSVSGWKGPYLNYEVVPADIYHDRLKFSVDYGSGEDVIFISQYNGNNWKQPSINPLTTSACSVAGSICYAYITFQSSSIPLPIVIDIDNIIDGGDGQNTGKFRWYDTGAYIRAFMRFAPVFN